MSTPESQTAEVRAVYDWLQQELAKYGCRITKPGTARSGGVAYWEFTENCNPQLLAFFGIEETAFPTFAADAVERSLGISWPAEALRIPPHGVLVRSDGSVDQQWNPPTDREVIGR